MSDVSGGGPDRDDRVLDEHDKYLISIGRAPKGGNGSWPQITPETHGQYVKSRVERQRAIKMARLEGYVEANRDFAHKLFEAKSGMISSLVDKAMSGGRFDADLLSPSEQNMLLKAVESVENRAFGKPTQKSEQSGEVSVVHKIAEWKNRLSDGRD